jgi:cell shape-determining protein MreD
MAFILFVYLVKSMQKILQCNLRIISVIHSGYLYLLSLGSWTHEQFL